jgi:hypothetical protein
MKRLYVMFMAFLLCISIRIGFNGVTIGTFANNQAVKQKDDYITNPNDYLAKHSNKENFNAMFSKFLRKDGNEVYDTYINSTRHKDSKVYKTGSRNNDQWEYNTVQDRFILSDESNIELI